MTILLNLQNDILKDCMEIIETNNFEYKNDIIQLYVEAFASGISEQFIDLEVLDVYINNFLENGLVFLTVENYRVLGAILACPLSFDEYVPSIITQSFQIEKCLYVAEMMVTENSRGNGIGKQLLAAFLENIDVKKHSDVFIRVWDKNTGAVSLYKSVGFNPFTTIEQTKMKVDGKETFMMNKIYLHKKIN